MSFRSNKSYTRMGTIEKEEIQMIKPIRKIFLIVKVKKDNKMCLKRKRNRIMARIKKNNNNSSNIKYEDMAYIYKNMFSFDWTCIDNKPLVPQMTASAYYFYLNACYFPTRLYNFVKENKSYESLCNFVFDPIDNILVDKEQTQGKTISNDEFCYSSNFDWLYDKCKRRIKGSYRIKDIIKELTEKIELLELENEKKLKIAHNNLLKYVEEIEEKSRFKLSETKVSASEASEVVEVTGELRTISKIEVSSSNFFVNANSHDSKFITGLSKPSEHSLLQDLTYVTQEKIDFFKYMMNQKPTPTQVKQKEVKEGISDILCDICNEKETEYQNDIYICKVIKPFLNELK